MKAANGLRTSSKGDICSTEGLVESFGPDGELATFMSDSRWLKFAYSTSANAVSLFVCVVGSRFFGRASVAVFAVVCACTALTLASFFQDDTYFHR